MLSIVDTWGSKLVAVSFIYTVVAMVVTFSSLAAGYQPPQLVSPSVMKAYASAYEAWTRISGDVITGGVTGYASAVFDLLNGVFNTLLATTATVTFSFIWLGYAVSSILPPPLDILRIPIWVAAFTANLVMLAYLIKTVYNMLSSAFGRFLPVPSV